MIELKDKTQTKLQGLKILGIIAKLTLFWFLIVVLLFANQSSLLAVGADQTIPSGTMLGFKTKTNASINLASGEYRSNSTDIKISISVTDSGNNLKDVQVSEDGITWGSVNVGNGSDGLANTADDQYIFTANNWADLGGPGGSYSGDIPFKLSSGDNKKTAYIRVRDTSGNIQKLDSYSDAFSSDTYKDIANTTANWDSAGARIILPTSWASYSIGSHLSFMSSPSYSLALDSNNNAYATLDLDPNSDGNIDSYIYYNNNASGSWPSPYNLATDGTAGGNNGATNSIAIDALGLPHIVYESGGSSILKYAKYVSGLWLTETIDASSSSNPSAIIDSNGKMRVSYTSSGNLKYATNASGSWQISTIDSAVNSPSINLDGNNKVHIAYLSWASGNYELRYATNVSGSWVTTTLGGNAHYGNTSLAVASDDTIHIAWEYRNNPFTSPYPVTLKYFTNVSGSWVGATLVNSRSQNNWMDPFASIAVGENNNVYIAYKDITQSNLQYYTNSSGSWQNIITSFASSGPNYHNRIIAAAEFNNIHLLYYNNSTIYHSSQEFNSSAQVTSNTVDLSAQDIDKATLTANQTLNSQNITYQMSRDGGVTWENATNGIEHTFTSTNTEKSDLRWRATLTGSSSTTTPVINSVALTYKTVNENIALNISTPNNPSSLSVVDINSNGTFGQIFNYPMLVATWPHVNARVSHGANSNDVTFVKYNLYRSTDNIFTANEMVYSGTNNYYVDDLNGALSGNRNYYYKVTSTDVDYESSGTTFGPINPAGIDKVAPLQTSVKEKVGVNSATLSWTINEKAGTVIKMGTKVSNKRVSGGVDINDDSNGGHTQSVAVKGLKPGTKYYYSIKSTDSEKNGPTVTTGSFKTDNFSISNVEVETSVSSATLRWKTNENSDSFVQFGEKSFTEKEVGNSKITSNHKIILDGLSQNKKYIFKIKSKDAYNNVTVKSSTGNTFKTKPFKVKDIKTTTSSNSAIISWTTNIPANSLVKYRGKNDKTSQVAGSSDFEKNHQVTLKNLDTATTYTFKIESRNSEDNVAKSGDNLSFATTSLQEGFNVNPQVSKFNEVEITATSAKINWTTEGETSSWVEYGPSTLLEKLAGNDTFTVDHIVVLDGLIPGNTYYFRVGGKDVDGNKYLSAISKFIALVKPKINSKPKVEVDINSTTISWDTNTETDSVVEFGLTSKYGDSAGSGVLTKSHSLKLDNLSQNTTYHFKLAGVDKFRNKTESGEFTFKTAKDNKGPIIKGMRNNILRNTNNAGKEKLSLIINFTTNEGATSYVEYAEGISLSTYNKKSQQNETLNLSHSTIIENLKPSTTYHYRVITRDKYGNMTKSLDKTLLTPKESETVLQRIIIILEDTFSWVSNLKDYMTQTAKKNNPVDLLMSKLH